LSCDSTFTFFNPGITKGFFTPAAAISTGIETVGLFIGGLLLLGILIFKGFFLHYFFSLTME